MTTWRRTAIVIAAAMLASCSSAAQPSASPGELAGDQTLRFAMAHDVVLDPARLLPIGADIDLARNVFSGLYRLDDDLALKPEIADSLPTVSADGLTLTFHLRRGVRFSNGDPVTATDVAYSWDRAAAVKDGCSQLFLIQGCFDVMNGKADRMSGVVVKDELTLDVTLTMPARGTFLMFLDRPATWPVDRKVIQSLGDPQWSRTAAGIVGTGPFRVTAWEPGQRLAFEPVAGWWGGSTGSLRRVDVEIVPSAAARLARYRAGGFDLLGYAGDAQVPSLDPADVQELRRDARTAPEVRIVPQAGTTWVQFNLAAGPFAGLSEGRLGRLAFSLAIDRDKVAAAACQGGTVCRPATGGLISAGLRGHLGAGADPNAKFDPTAARDAYAKWDPDGSKVTGLDYVYNSTPQNQLVAESLQAQWKQILGVTVRLQPVDGQTFFANRSDRAYTLFREYLDVTLDAPGQWYGGVFVTPPPLCGCGYSNPDYTRRLLSTLRQPVDQALPEYDAIGRMLINDVVYAALFYEVKIYVAKPYLRGIGGNALYDDLWSSARVLRH